MPISDHRTNIPRMQATAIDYKPTDDGEYTELDIPQAVHNVKTVHNTQFNTVVQRSTTKSSTFSKTRLLIAVLSVIAIIAVISVIVLAVLYGKGTDDKQNTHTIVGSSTTPTANKDFIELDISSLHKTKFASSNRTMMSNTFFDGSIAGPGKRPLMNYYGVLADRSILEGEQLDIRFKVDYKIIKKGSSNNLIFDFAICSLCNIDKHWYGGSTANCWDMSSQVDEKTNSIKLYFADNGIYSSNQYSISSLNVGTTKIVSYNIHISGRTSGISYNDLSGKHLNTFSNVNFSQPLYILFGLYNPHKFKSVLQIL